jgi:hypothetical protein
MNTPNRRDLLLSTIAIEPSLLPVIDDLAGLERLVPQAPSEIEGLAIFRNQLPGLLAVRGRADAHAGEVRSMISMIAREPDQVEAWIDVINALTILANAANLTLLLLPVRSEDDGWAREDFGRYLLRHARHNGDGEDLALVRRAVGALPRRSAHLTLPTRAEEIGDIITTMARRVGALQPKLVTTEPGAPGTYPLEQAESLKSYFAAAPHLAGLLDGARHVFGLVDALRCGGDQPEMTAGAIEGGLVLAYARLLRIALWPARDRQDVAAKISARDLARSRDADLDRFGALWEIAFNQGETVAGQSSRFLNVDEQD